MWEIQKKFKIKTFYAFPVIIIDTVKCKHVTANRYERKHSRLMQKNQHYCTFVGFMLIAVKVWNEKLGLAICFTIVTTGSS